MLRPAIFHLAEWLKSKDLALKHETTHALFKLSYNVKNCIIMYEANVSKVKIYIILY